MKKRVLLLAVSCKTGGLCPGGLDLDNPTEWIRIVKDDGNAGAVQGVDIDFAKPLDVIEFDGKSMPQGRQKENWVILNNSCEKLGRANVNGDTSERAVLAWAYSSYPYHGFWGNYKSFLNEDEFVNGTEPSESIMKVTNIRIYQDDNCKAKIDFDWSGARYRIKWISMTDQDCYDAIADGDDVEMNEAYIVISIPKDLWLDAGDGRAYKFVSRVYKIS